MESVRVVTLDDPTAPQASCTGPILPPARAKRRRRGAAVPGGPSVAGRTPVLVVETIPRGCEAQAHRPPTHSAARSKRSTAAELRTPSGPSFGPPHSRKERDVERGTRDRRAAGLVRHFAAHQPLGQLQVAGPLIHDARCRMAEPMEAGPRRAARMRQKLTANDTRIQALGRKKTA